MASFNSSPRLNTMCRMTGQVRDQEGKGGTMISGVFTHKGAMPSLLLKMGQTLTIAGALENRR